jgi:predicted anti-sigma-YlaC factor YlaD
MEANRNCESFEILLSTWIDGPLERGEQIECLDHLARCEDCRRFYREARALEGCLSQLRTPVDAPPAPAEVWQRIRWETRKDLRRARRLPAWIFQAAAVVVLSIGLSVVVWNHGGTAIRPDLAEVQLGAGGQMSEERFVELTKEVLGADVRYHAAMYRIMEQVVRDTTPEREAAFESDVRSGEGSRKGEGVEISGRIPA